MATGDITAVRILASGYQAEIDISGFVVGGAANFGITGTNNDPSAAKIVFTVTSEGYNDSAVLRTISRTVYGTIAQRKAYPNQAQKEESASGGTLTVRVVLSEWVHNDDTATVSVASGFYTDSGAGGGSTASNAVTALAVTNSSTIDYPIPIANWSCLDRDVVGNSLTVSALAFQAYGQQKRPIRAIKFTATDESANSVSTIVTEMTYAADSNLDAIPFPEYIGTLNISSLTDDQEITVNMEVYPWFGDADAVAKSATTGFVESNWRLRPIKYFKDANLSHGYPVAVVDPVNGNNTAGVVASGIANIATAQAAPYLNIYSAVKAIQTYNGTYNARTNTSGGTVYLTAGTHDMAGGTTTTTNTGTIKTPLTIRPLPGVSKSSVIITPNATSTNRYVIGTYLKFVDLTFTRSSDAYWVRGAAGRRASFNNCDFTDTRQTGSYLNSHYGFDKIEYYRCSFDDVRGGASAFTRGCTITREYNSYYLTFSAGNNFVSTTSIIWDESTDITNDVAGGICAYNKAMSLTDPVMAVFQQIDTLSGLAVVGNLFELLDTGGTPAISISADGTTSITDHVVFWQNTVLGQRCNLAYNDTGTVATPHTNWSIKYNFLDYLANKNDTFANNANCIGGWPVEFGVGTHGNVVGDAAFEQEFVGTYSVGNITRDNTGFQVVDYKAAAGGSGNGDYHLTATSPAVSRIPSGGAVLPYDISGAAIDDTGLGDAGAYQYSVRARRGWPLQFYNLINH